MTYSIGEYIVLEIVEYQRDLGSLSWFELVQGLLVDVQWVVQWVWFGECFGECFEYIET